MTVTKKHLALFTLYASAIWLWSGVVHRAPRPATVSPSVRTPPAPPVPQFPTGGPSPAGRVLLPDVQFAPVENRLLPGLPNMSARYSGGVLTLTEPVHGVPFTVVNGQVVRPHPRTPALWTGPISRARFLHRSIGGVDTVKDSAGQVVWSNADETASPDLLILSAPEGETRILDKKGVMLWSGTLPQARTRSSSTGQGNGSYRMDSNGIHIAGTNGSFRVTDDAKRLLWSGTLPASPRILVRQGNRYSFSGPNRGASGQDSVSEIRFAAETGTVTIESIDGKIVGSRLIDVLKCRTETLSPSSLRFNGQPRILTPTASLTTNGTVLLTYRDSAGTIIRRSRVYRSGSSWGTSG